MNAEVQAITETWQEVHERMLQFGLRELEHRKRDLQDKSPEGLKLAKRNAEIRRKEANLDANTASIWVREARKALKQGKVEVVNGDSEFIANPTSLDMPTTAGEVW